MIKYLTFILFLIKINVGFSQEDKTYNNKFQLIYKDSLITENRVGGISLGDDFKKLIDKYDFIEDYNEYYLKINDRLILSIWSKDEKSVSGITVYSNDFKTQNDFFVGFDINKILKIYPDIKINLSEETQEEYFSIGDYFDNNDNTFLIYLKSNFDNKLGRYNSDDFGPESDDFMKMEE
jgi:hypothetical protein